ncbi:pimeloyl-[acyl-carrier protein] methyl ester esterase [Corallincola holothuriorum]|uniref:Pimeloyl-[acyl-carrier protein] methyl ester esterase n=1 Tax=Corallincola holothuriorum TaxID=2282215 RepID=A0A368NMP5_9GAMM|nr:pimeloyl-ACP methyl ester esterase BioH [Corallincola holothuriorum]RCU51125.1 pimeloyl-[acyl-carrier protein] methyl ester esterase [Corallincola holothuriorum]
MSEQISEAPYLHVETIGKGPDLVMLHGWGLNGAVWQSLTASLSQHYTLHLVDLPGFGDSELLAEYQLPALASHLLAALPERAIWLGWSLGGLVATQVALMAPHRVSHLVLVASSPKFVADGQWPGIKPEVLQQFQTQLKQNFSRTLERFLAIQAMGSPTARDDVKALKQQLMARRDPHPLALSSGLKLLETVDLRSQLADLNLPISRFYGRLDALVPAAAQSLINELCVGNDVCFSKASHAPFISHGELFVAALIDRLGKH